MAAAAGARSTAPGVVELREDVPLKAAGGAGGAGGVRALVACFAALSAGVTVALLAQVWAGAGGAVPHGAAAAGACSGAAAGVLRAGGSAVDAAAAAAFCLAVAAPNDLSLHSSGALLHWEYRTRHSQPPQLTEWGAARAGVGTAPPAPAVPRLAAALAALHAAHGALPWPQVLQPAIDLALNGAAATASQPATPPRASFGAALAALQRNTSAELWAQWSAEVPLRQGPAPAWPVAGGWVLYAGGGGAGRAASALVPPLPEDPSDSLVASVVRRLWAAGPAERPARGAAAALADTRGAYVALVAGDAQAGAPATGAPLDVAAAMLVDGSVCGARYVLAAAGGGALAQVAARLAAGAAPAAAVEPARAVVRAGPAGPLLELEPGRAGAPPAPPGVLPVSAALPSPAVAVLRQTGDALAGHADSRAGGLAARF